MKKRIAYLLAAAMLLGLTACGGGTAAESSSAGSAQSSGSAEEPLSAGSGEESAANEGSESTERELTFEETTFIDNEYLSFIVTGIDPTGSDYYTLEVEMENKTADLDLSIECHGVYADGIKAPVVYWDGLDDSVLSPGETVQCALTFDYVEEMGYSDYTDLEIAINAYSYVDGSLENRLVEETFHVYPYGEENAATYTREANGTDQVIFENEYVRVTSTGYIYEDDYFTMGIYVENKASEGIDLCMGSASDHCAVNGYEVRGFDTVDGNLAVGKSAFGMFRIPQEDLTANGIEKVETMELSLEVIGCDQSFDTVSTDIVTVAVE